jgi:hypothetical protein
VASIQRRGLGDILLPCQIGREAEEGPVGDMLPTILFILTNLQHSTADSTIVSRIAVVKGMDIALIQEPSYFEGRILWV